MLASSLWHSNTRKISTLTGFAWKSAWSKGLTQNPESRPPPPLSCLKSTYPHFARAKFQDTLNVKKKGGTLFAVERPEEEIVLASSVRHLHAGGSFHSFHALFSHFTPHLFHFTPRSSHYTTCSSHFTPLSSHITHLSSHFTPLSSHATQRGGDRAGFQRVASAITAHYLI